LVALTNSPSMAIRFSQRPPEIFPMVAMISHQLGFVGGQVRGFTLAAVAWSESVAVKARR
jgi:hypothetical protein